MFDVNVAGWERVARIVLGVALLGVAWGGVVAGGLETALKVIGFVPLLTGIFGWCPLYALLGVSTHRGFHRTRAARAH